MFTHFSIESLRHSAPAPLLGSSVFAAAAALRSGKKGQVQKMLFVLHMYMLSLRTWWVCEGVCALVCVCM